MGCGNQTNYSVVTKCPPESPDCCPEVISSDGSVVITEGLASDETSISYDLAVPKPDDCCPRVVAGANTTVDVDDTDPNSPVYTVSAVLDPELTNSVTSNDGSVVIDATANPDGSINFDLSVSDTNTQASVVADPSANNYSNVTLDPASTAEEPEFIVNTQIDICASEGGPTVATPGVTKMLSNESIPAWPGGAESMSVFLVDDPIGAESCLVVGVPPSGTATPTYDHDTGLFVDESVAPAGGSVQCWQYDGGINGTLSAIVSGAAPLPTTDLIVCTVEDSVGNVLDATALVIAPTSTAATDLDGTVSIEYIGSVPTVTEETVTADGGTVTVVVYDAAGGVLFADLPTGVSPPFGTAYVVAVARNSDGDIVDVDSASPTQVIVTPVVSPSICAEVTCQQVAGSDPAVYEHVIDTSMSILNGATLTLTESDGLTPIAFPIADAAVPADRIVLVKATDADGNVYQECEKFPLCPVVIPSGGLQFFAGGGSPCVKVVDSIGSYHDTNVPVYDVNGGNIDAAGAAVAMQDMETFTFTNPNDTPVLIAMNFSQSHHLKYEGFGLPALDAGNIIAEAWGSTQQMRFGLLTNPQLYATDFNYTSSPATGNHPAPQGMGNDFYVKDSDAVAGTTMNGDKAATAPDGSTRNPYNIPAFARAFQQYNSSLSQGGDFLRLGPNETKTFGLNVYLYITNPIRTVSQFDSITSATQQNVSAWDLNDTTSVLSDDYPIWFRWHGTRGFSFYTEPLEGDKLPIQITNGNITYAAGRALAGV